MAERTYEDAVAALQQHIGGRFEGTRDEGREEMMRVLTDRLGYDHGTARETLEALARSGRIRYVTADIERRGDADEMTAPPVAVSPNNTGAAVPAIPTPTETVPGPGYWEIGAPDAPGDNDPLGTRKGQIRPT